MKIDTLSSDDLVDISYIAPGQEGYRAECADQTVDPNLVAYI